jgi:hypothetical protein
MAINETSNGQPNSIAVTATGTGAGSIGILSKGDAVGIRGDGRTWHGVVGFSEGGFGVYGEAVGSGVVGVSKKWVGVYGETSAVEGGPAGVWGEHKTSGAGVKAVSKDGAGLVAYSNTHEAVHAETRSPGTASIAAYNLNPEGTGAAVFAKKEGTKGHAGFFDGNVWITGELGVGKDIVLPNADCAEDFDIADISLAEPGTVMVLGETGLALQPSNRSYDKRVAGVISGAGAYKPGIVLDKQKSKANRLPIALVGKVFCKVDANAGSIEIGDLLTTSDTPGHAMKATDISKALGTVIGKALGPMKEGKGMIPILIALL